MHVMNPEIKEFGFLTMMPQYISFGLLFGIISVLDNGIELAIGAHAANNIFLSIFVTQKSSTLQTVAMFEQQTGSSVDRIFVPDYFICHIYRHSVYHI